MNDRMSATKESRKSAMLACVCSGRGYEKVQIFWSRLPDLLSTTFCDAWMAFLMCNHDVIISDTIVCRIIFQGMPEYSALGAGGLVVVFYHHYH